MAAQIDADVWLNAKLEEPWSSERVSSQLTVPILQQARARYALLETPIKLRLLFAFASLRRNRKLREELADDVRQLLALGDQDDDEWVRVMSKMLGVLLQQDEQQQSGSAAAAVDLMAATPASRGGSAADSLHDHLEALAMALNNEHFTDVIEQVRQRLEERGRPLSFYPLEFAYLNRELVVPEPATTTEPHFRLKKPLEEPAPLTLIKRSSSKVVTARGVSTPDISDRGGLSRSGSKSLTGSSSALRASTGGQEPTLKRSLSASRGSSGLSSSQKKLRILDINEVLAFEQNQEKENLKKKREEEELEKERRRKEKQDAAEAKRQEREEKKKKKLEEIEKRKAKKEEEKAEKEAKRKERLAAQAQIKAQRRAAAAAAAFAKKPITSASSPEPTSPAPDMSPTTESPATTPAQTPNFSPVASPFPTPAQAANTPPLPRIQPPSAGLTSPNPTHLPIPTTNIMSPAGGLGMTVGGTMGVGLGSASMTTAAAGQYGSSLAPSLHGISPQSHVKSYTFTQLGGMPPGSLGTSSFLQTTRTGGQASSLLSQALLPQTQTSTLYGQQPPQSALSSFTVRAMHQQPAPSSLTYLNQQQQIPQTTYGMGSNLIGGLSSSPMMPSYTASSHLSQPPQTAPAATAAGVPSNLLEQANKLSDSDRAMLVAFLQGETSAQAPTQGIRQIILNEEEKLGEGGARYLEQIIFEINYQNGSWRKLRRKKNVTATSAVPTPYEERSNPT